VIYLIAGLAACSVTLVGLALLQLAPSHSRAVSRRLVELEQITSTTYGTARLRDRQARRERWGTLLQELGERVEQRAGHTNTTRAMLISAGYRSPNAVAVYWASRVLLPLLLVALALVASPATGARMILIAPLLAVPGWIAPVFFVGARVRKRQAELQKALPDALDSMVVCVEAGLGLNQAIMRVAEEMRHISVLMSDELAMVNLEIRAGMPREEALRNLGDRTGLEDIRGLTGMLIQTERFGTSIAQALRVHSDSLRVRRRQRAEETAAKMSIKMLFPLIFFVLPAMFVITLGPAMLRIVAALAQR
jgi:tight adherence protein C